MPIRIDASLSGALADSHSSAARAAAAGYDAVWSAETAHDPFLPLARAADAITASMELGTGIAVAFARSPMTLAHTAWDLQELTGGRFVLGLGSQVRAHIERRFSMPWSRPAARMRELVIAMHAIWHSWQTGERLQFAGDFYTHTLASPMFTPPALPCPPPKVMLAAVGEAMTRVAAEVADGLILHTFTTRRYIQDVTVPAVEATLAKFGRSRDKFQIAYTPFVVTGRDEADLARSADLTRERIAFYGATPAYRAVLGLHGWGELQTDLNTLARAGRWSEMGALVDDEMLNAFAVVAPVDSLPEALAAWIAPLADRTRLQPPEGVAGDAAADFIARVREACRDTARATAR